MLKRLSNYFVRGLIFLTPITLTVYIFYKAFIRIDGWLGLKYPGVGFLITIAGVTLLGFLTSNFLTRSLFALLEKVLEKVPFVKLLHSSLKDLLTALVGEKRKFDRPVAVDILPGSGVKALGFVTTESLAQFQMVEHVAVYFPQSFHFAGNLLLFPRSQVAPLPTDSATLMAFILSGGIALSPR